MPRFFNTAGPCDEARHYMLPAEARLPELDRLVEREQYFVVHAPRQTGKTTAMRAVAKRLRSEGYVALHATLEESQGVEDLDAAERRWLDSIELDARGSLPDECRPPDPREYGRRGVGTRLRAWLEAWCRSVPDRALVLLLDEVDVVRGEAMVGLLRQLRAGYPHRRAGRFPVSIGLVGMRDLRDYLARAKDGRPVSPGSPFNVKAASLTLSSFTAEEVAELCGQHTRESGQKFEPASLERLYWWTQGQPYLVNAFAALATDDIQPNREVPITSAHIDSAKENLVLARATHLDSLSERLREPRVARVVEPTLLGDAAQAIEFDSDDFQYVLDLGLLRRGPDGPEAANPLYREVMARQLAFNVQESLPDPWWPWRRPDGGLDMPALVDAFLGWWREHSEILHTHSKPGYREAVAHLAFMGFLQRVVNGGGSVLREYAAARGRIDLVVDFEGERHAVELKRIPPTGRSADRVRSDGIGQLVRYLDGLGLDEGWLIVFDQRPGRPWEERLWSDEVEVEGKRLHLRGA